MKETMDFYKEYTKNSVLRLALIPTKDFVVFPGSVKNFEVETPASLGAIKSSLEGDNLVFLCAKLDPDSEHIIGNVANVGVVARIEDVIVIAPQAVSVSVRALCRASVDSFETLKDQSDYYMINVSYLDYDENPSSDLAFIASEIKNTFKKYLQHSGNTPEEAAKIISETNSYGELVNTIMTRLDIEVKEALEVLGATDLKMQLGKVKGLLDIEMIKIGIEAKLQQDTLRQIGQEQKEHFLRQTQRQIAKQLGEDDDTERLDEYEKKVTAIGFSSEDTEKLMKEIDSLEKMPPSSQESYILENHLDFVCSLPKMKKARYNFDLKKAREIMDKDQYGLEEVKERIIESLAVTLLCKKNPPSVLCLVGPPGVGKTMIASSVAKVMKRKFCKMSLGGLGDESEIRGHRKTYIGAMSGKILSSIALCKTNNPVFLLDEIDKLSKDYKGDPASALLEALDPNQNTSFTDRYAEVSYDLSNVFFIATANTTATIPAPLLDRMEIIEIPGYSDNEKLNIAKLYQLPTLKKSHGLEKSKIKFDDEAILKIITNYTRESGVRDLERKLSKILRIVAKDEVTKVKKSHHITADNLKDYLKEDFEFIPGESDESKVGIMKGLAYTSVGGDTLDIETAIYEGNGELKLTGNLGDVLKESAVTALSFIRANQSSFGLSDESFDKKTIHIHVPEGATPKDGPSAGITLTMALLSLLTGKKAQSNLAMTGEISLSGSVLPVGGLKEKLLAAKRAGVKEVFLPKKNETEVENFNADITSKLTISYVSSISQAYSLIRWS